jgi:hypothetical protein
MKIIFLDSDGVLLHSESDVIPEHLKTEPHGSSFYYAAKIDLECVQRLLVITRATKAQVVITSMWRLNPKQNTAICRAFLYAGVHRHDYEEIVIGSTPNINSENRDAEITAWLKDHPTVKQYLVIDDHVIGQHPQLSKRPDYFKGGLLEEHIQEAIQKLS